jgi:hypothetical protein
MADGDEPSLQADLATRRIAWTLCLRSQVVCTPPYRFRSPCPRNAERGTLGCLLSTRLNRSWSKTRRQIKGRNHGLSGARKSLVLVRQLARRRRGTGFKAIRFVSKQGSETMGMASYEISLATYLMARPPKRKGRKRLRDEGSRLRSCNCCSFSGAEAGA